MIHGCSPTDATTRARAISASISLAVVTLVLLTLPLAYQTNDDPMFAQILQGDRLLGLAPDAYCMFVHYFLGSIVKTLSAAWPGIAWYGVLILALTLVGYVTIGSHVGEAVGGPASRRVTVVLLVLIGFGLLPLVLLQFTIVAGLLSVAAMVPYLRRECLGQSTGGAVWIVSVACLMLAFMLRFQMAAMVLLCCAPVLALGYLRHRSWRRLGRHLALLIVFVGAGFGLKSLNDLSCLATPSCEGFFAFNRLRTMFSDRLEYKYGLPVRVLGAVDEGGELLVPDGRGTRTTLGTPDQLAPIDRTMLESFMAMNSGPLSLQNLRRVSGGAGPTRTEADADETKRRSSEPGSPPYVPDGKLQTRKKLEGIVHGSNLRHLRLTMYLLAVVAGGMALAVASGALGHWRSLAYSLAAGFGAVLSFALSTVVLDRAVFRAMLPCAFLFLVVSVVVFPWREAVLPSRLPRWPRRAFSLAVTGFFMALVLSVGLAVIQIRVNMTNAAIYEDLIDDVCRTFAADYTVVAWDWAVPIHYRSPLVRGDDRCVAIYPVSIMSSHPRLLQRLEERFGEDVYEGIARPGVIHLASPRQVEILEAFYVEHYGGRLEVAKLATFYNGTGDTGAYVLVNSRVPRTSGAGGTGGTLEISAGAHGPRSHRQ